MELRLICVIILHYASWSIAAKKNKGNKKVMQQNHSNSNAAAKEHNENNSASADAQLFLNGQIWESPKDKSKIDNRKGKNTQNWSVNTDNLIEKEKESDRKFGGLQELEYSDEDPYDEMYNDIWASNDSKEIKPAKPDYQLQNQQWRSIGHHDTLWKKVKKPKKSKFNSSKPSKKTDLWEGVWPDLAWGRNDNVFSKESKKYKYDRKVNSIHGRGGNDKSINKTEKFVISNDIKELLGEDDSDNNENNVIFLKENEYLWGDKMYKAPKMEEIIKDNYQKVNKKNRPNILLIVADDLGYNDVPWHNPDVKAPHLNKLARKGVILENHYVLPVCTPSRAALLTGVYPFRYGRQIGATRPLSPIGLNTSLNILPQRLQRLGYKTHLVGKWHLGYCSKEYTPTRRGFDSFYGFYLGSQTYFTHFRDLKLNKGESYLQDEGGYWSNRNSINVQQNHDYTNKRQFKAQRRKVRNFKMMEAKKNLREKTHQYILSGLSNREVNNQNHISIKKNKTLGLQKSPGRRRKIRRGRVRNSFDKNSLSLNRKSKRFFHRRRKYKRKYIYDKILKINYQSNFSYLNNVPAKSLDLKSLRYPKNMKVNKINNNDRKFCKYEIQNMLPNIINKTNINYSNLLKFCRSKKFQGVRKRHISLDHDNINDLTIIGLKSLKGRQLEIGSNVDQIKTKSIKPPNYAHGNKYKEVEGKRLLIRNRLSKFNSLYKDKRRKHKSKRNKSHEWIEERWNNFINHEDDDEDDDGDNEDDWSEDEDAQDPVQFMNNLDAKTGGYDFRFNDEPLVNVTGLYSNDLFATRAEDIFRGHWRNLRREEKKGGDADPFFLMLSLQAVHGPLQVPLEYRRKYRNVPNIARRTFLAMVSALDDTVGRVVEALKAYGLYNNTVIAFTSDNGGNIRSGGNNFPLRGSKGGLYEGGTKGVAFIHSPLLPETGYKYTGLMHMVDWHNTLLDVAGGGLASWGSHEGGGHYNGDGYNLWPYIVTNTQSPRTSFIYNVRKGPLRGAIRHKNWKLVVGNAGRFDGWIPPDDVTAGALLGEEKKKCCSSWQSKNGQNHFMLFNLKDDPLETTDLSNHFPQVVLTLKSRLRSYAMESITPQIPRDDARGHPSLHGGFFSPGWCNPVV